MVQGNKLSEEERARTVQKLAEFTGLEKSYVQSSNLRISRDAFLSELLRGEKQRLGILDSRITGDYKVREFTEDPSFFQVTGPLIATWSDYVRRELEFESDLPYVFLSPKANRQWDWTSGTGGLGFLNVATTLQESMKQNRFLRVFVASGFYDLDTSHFAAKYTLNHLDLPSSLLAHITPAYYEAGHQMYTDLSCLRELREDVKGFFKKALPRD